MILASGSRLRGLAPVTVFGIVVSTLSLSGCGSPSVGTPPLVAERDSIVAMARLEPRGQVVRVAAGEDGILLRLAVAEGDQVKAGDAIGYLSSYDLRERDVRAAELKVRRMRLGPLEVEAQAARVRMSEVEAAHYKAELEKQKALVDTGLVPGKQVDATALLARKAEEAAMTARADLKRLEGSSAVGVDEARNDLSRAQALFERAAVRSPIDGSVLRILARPGERIAGAIMEIGATAEMTAVAEVHVNDIHLVKVGQVATFESPALPKAVRGQVVQIGSMIGKNRVFGEDPAAPDNARVFQVTVQLDDSSVAKNFTNLEGQLKIALKGGR